MAEYQKIEYQIANNGQVTETVINGQGETCTLVTEDLEKSLGRVESRRLLAEYYADGADNFLITEQNQGHTN
jgi:Protein of unknown function (DUF2997)